MTDCLPQVVDLLVSASVYGRLGWRIRGWEGLGPAVSISIQGVTSRTMISKEGQWTSTICINFCVLEMQTARPTEVEILEAGPQSPFLFFSFFFF